MCSVQHKNCPLFPAATCIDMFWLPKTNILVSVWLGVDLEENLGKIQQKSIRMIKFMEKT